MDPDRAIERVARRQHGAFNRRQAIAAGFTDDMVRRRVLVGQWLRLAESVYALPSHPGSFLRQCWAAVLSEPEAAIGGFAAASLLGLAGCRPGRVELVVPPTANARNPLARVHRYDGAQRTELGGLPITTVVQTIFDIAGRSSYDTMERILDDVLLRRRTTVDALDQRFAEYAGTRRAGRPLLGAMLEDRRATGWQPTESELERQLKRVLRHQLIAHGARWQHPFPWRNALPGRVDVYLEVLRLIIEADGRRWHARLGDFDRDRWRDNQAVAHGIQVLRFTSVHLLERPHEVQALVAAVARRGAA